MGINGGDGENEFWCSFNFEGDERLCTWIRSLAIGGSNIALLVGDWGKGPNDCKSLKEEPASAFRGRPGLFGKPRTLGGFETGVSRFENENGEGMMSP
jgi:hypothetical protein